jgi:Tfp pilus assembly PilM family ATPase
VVISGPHGAEPRLAAIVEETTRAEVVAIEGELPQLAIESLREAAPGGDASSWITAFGLACRERHAQAEAPVRKRSAA